MLLPALYDKWLSMFARTVSRYVPSMWQTFSSDDVMLCSVIVAKAHGGWQSMILLTQKCAFTPNVFPGEYMTWLVG